jgi:hypothetical protein
MTQADGPLKILVTGGREYSNRPFVFAVLDRVHRARGISLIIHGAARGADTIAGEWAASRGVEQMRFPISPEEWRRLGPVAGPMRNHRMLLAGKPNGVIAFPGGAGTADQVRRSILEGVPVWDLRQHPRA